jgi:iron-sulfur cluster repair protein YtfE (RIC family)
MKNQMNMLLPGLQPISRDHGVALVCAHYGRLAVRANDEDRRALGEQINDYCKSEITPNLVDEQWILSPLIGDADLRREFHQRHKAIKDLSAQLSKIDLSKSAELGLLSRVASTLDDYVRWEENTLFPRIAEGIAKEDAQHLSKLTTEMEVGRNRTTQRLHHSIAGH